MKQYFLYFLVFSIISSCTLRKNKPIEVYPLYPYIDSLAFNSTSPYLPLHDSERIYSKYLILENYTDINDTDRMKTCLNIFFNSKEEKLFIEKKFHCQYDIYKTKGNFNKDFRVNADITFFNIRDKYVAQYIFIKTKLIRTSFYSNGVFVFPEPATNKSIKN